MLNKVLKKSQRSKFRRNNPKNERSSINNQGHLVFRDNPPRTAYLVLWFINRLLKDITNIAKNVPQDVQVLLANFHHFSDTIRYSVGVGEISEHNAT